jgi:hypothetical protein
MSVSARQRFGTLLIAISMVALGVFLEAGIRDGHWHYDGSGALGKGFWMTFSGESGVSGYYLIPIFLCGAIGVFCLAWPTRKPPKLNQ